MRGPGFCLERIGQGGRIGFNKTILADEPQAMVGSDSQNIGLAAPFEQAAQARIRSVHGIGQNKSTRDAGVERLFDEIAGDLGLGGEADRIRDLRLEAPLLRLSPRLLANKAAGRSAPGQTGSHKPGKRQFENSRCALLSPNIAGLRPPKTRLFSQSLFYPRSTHKESRDLKNYLYSR